MFVCKDCINKFEPVVALATFYKTCEICGEERDCLDLASHVKRIDILDIESEVLELIIEHKDGKFINWSMRDPNDPTRKFGEDDTALVEQVIMGFPEKEPEIHPDILKAARGDGAAHYSTGDGQQYLVTFIGMKETTYEGPDISLDEPQCETGPDNDGNCPYFPSYPTPCQKIRKDHKCPTENTDPKRWACEVCGADQGEFSRNPVTNYPKYPGNCTECGGHVGYAKESIVKESLPSELSYLKDAHPRVQDYAKRMIKSTKEPEEGKTFSEPCPECNTSIPYGPGNNHEDYPTKCPNCGASMEED